MSPARPDPIINRNPQERSSDRSQVNQSEPNLDFGSSQESESRRHAPPSEPWRTKRRKTWISDHHTNPKVGDSARGPGRDEGSATTLDRASRNGNGQASRPETNDPRTIFGITFALFRPKSGRRPVRAIGHGGGPGDRRGEAVAPPVGGRAVLAGRIETTMRRTLLLAALPMAILGLAGCGLFTAPPAVGAPAGPQQPGVPRAGQNIPQRILLATNQERQKQKLPPLKENDHLDRAAQGQAQDMAAQNLLSHKGSDGSNPTIRVQRQGYKPLRGAENVAEGAPTISEVMRIWMNSPPHRENILGDYNEMGVGYAEAADGTPYWCVDFATPMVQLDPSKAPAALLEAINKARDEARQPPLKMVEALARAADHHARDNAERGKLNPRDKDGKAPFERAQDLGYHPSSLAQSDASGHGAPSEIVQLWLKDQSNKKNVLGDFGEAGIGYATDKRGNPYWTLIVGSSEK
jgi:uncharacterized protein YkwD